MIGDISKDIQSQFKNEWIKALINIRYTSNWLGGIIDKKFAKYGLSTQQYNVLRILRGAKKSIPVSEVKSRMVEKTPNTTRLMDKLLSKELISRSRSEMDRRVVYVEITTKGLDLLKAIPTDDDEHILQNITEEEAVELNRILDKLR